MSFARADASSPPQDPSMSVGDMLVPCASICPRAAAYAVSAAGLPENGKVDIKLLKERTEALLGGISDDEKSDDETAPTRAARGDETSESNGDSEHSICTLQRPRKDPSSKRQQLTAEEAAEIYARRPVSHKRGRMFRKGSMNECKKLGPKYGVTAKTIRDIWYGRTWQAATRHLWTNEEVAQRENTLAVDSAGPNAQFSLNRGAGPGLDSFGWGLNRDSALYQPLPVASGVAEKIMIWNSQAGGVVEAPAAKSRQQLTEKPESEDCEWKDPAAPRRPFKDPSSKRQQLTAEEAAEIYARRPVSHKRGRMFRKGSMNECKKLGPKYGVTAKTIRDIWYGRTWQAATRHLWTNEEVAQRTTLACGGQVPGYLSTGEFAHVGLPHGSALSAIATSQHGAALSAIAGIQSMSDFPGKWANVDFSSVSANGGIPYVNAAQRDPAGQNKWANVDFSSVSANGVIPYVNAAQRDPAGQNLQGDECGNIHFASGDNSVGMPQQRMLDLQPSGKFPHQNSALRAIATSQHGAALSAIAGIQSMSDFPGKWANVDFSSVSANGVIPYVNAAQRDPAGQNLQGDECGNIHFASGDNSVGMPQQRMLDLQPSGKFSHQNLPLGSTAGKIDSQVLQAMVGLWDNGSMLRSFANSTPVLGTFANSTGVGLGGAYSALPQGPGPGVIPLGSINMQPFG